MPPPSDGIAPRALAAAREAFSLARQGNADTLPASCSTAERRWTAAGPTGAPRTIARLDALAK